MKPHNFPIETSRVVGINHSNAPVLSPGSNRSTGQTSTLNGPQIDPPPKARDAARSVHTSGVQNSARDLACRQRHFKAPYRIGWIGKDALDPFSDNTSMDVSSSLAPSSPGHSIPISGSFHMRPPSSFGWYTSSHL